MPVQTAIQVRRGTASSWTSTNPTLAAGEIGFETDTGKFKIGTGSAAWASLAYTAIPETIFAAKGDILTATANDTPAILTAGSNGDTLVADSAATTGLRWQGNYSAGKNKIINGDFNIWQRGTSFSPASSQETYTADRWVIQPVGFTTRSVSQQTFTPGTAPVSGYESQYFIRFSGTGGDANSRAEFLQKIEDVRTFAGQTVTISFWAKADSSRSLRITPFQVFGTGGSSNVGLNASDVTVTTSWARYSYTLAIPAISGKTVGTGSALFFYIGLIPGNASGSPTLDLWGVQVEAGNVATAFQTATGTLQGELAACQRYYYRTTATQVYSDFGSGYNKSTTEGSFMIPFPVTMRTTPTALEQSGTASNYNILHQSGGSPARTACSSVPTYQVATPTMARVDFIVASGLTAGNGAVAGSNNNTTAYLGWSAEL